MTKVDANLFRLVHGCISTSDMRYYLNGVRIEPHGDGAVMVATDGHRMLVAFDETGVVDAPVTVKLPPFAIRECKAPAMFGDKRVLTIDAGANAATIEHVSQSKIKDADPVVDAVLTAHRVIVGGDFVDWRRVVPSKEINPTDRAAFIGFNGKYLTDWAKVGMELSKAGQTSAVSIQQVGDGDPAIVRWSGVDNIFGVQMPMRTDASGLLPKFMAEVQSAKAA